MQAQDLERIRHNQQRSRERKRAYIAELEQKVARLNEQNKLDNEACTTHVSIKLRNENDARQALLLALGVATSAQDLFIQNFTMRSRSGEPSSVGDGQGGIEGFGTSLQMGIPEIASPSLELRASTGGDCRSNSLLDSAELHHSSAHGQNSRPTHSLANVSHVPLPLGLQCDEHSLARSTATLSSAASSSASIDATTSFPGSTQDMLQYGTHPSAHSAQVDAVPDAPISTFEALTSSYPSTTFKTTQPCSLSKLPESEDLPIKLGCSNPLTPSLYPRLDNAYPQNACLHAHSYNSDGTTACSIAFGIITQNNAVGYTAPKLESMLTAGYRITEGASEDCRILNKVLFAVLAEIS